MATAYQCDRCFRFKEGKPASRVTIENPPPVDPLKPELCEDCLAATHDFLNAYKADAAKRAETLRLEPGFGKRPASEDA